MKKVGFVLGVTLFLFLFGCTDSKPKEMVKLHPNEVFEPVGFFKDVHVGEEGISVGLAISIQSDFIAKISKSNHRYETMYRLRIGVFEVSEYDTTSRMTRVIHHDIISYRVNKDETYCFFTILFDFDTYPTLTPFLEKSVLDNIIFDIDFLDDFDEVEHRVVSHTYIKTMGDKIDE